MADHSSRDLENFERDKEQKLNPFPMKKIIVEDLKHNPIAVFVPDRKEPTVPLSEYLILKKALEDVKRASVWAIDPYAACENIEKIAKTALEGAKKYDHGQ